MVALPQSGSNSTAPISISRVVDYASQIGIELPLVIRFPEIITGRVNRFRNGFEEAVSAGKYRNRTRMLMPIKVNPEDGVIRTFLQANKGFPTGLEVGSRAELVCAIHHLMGVNDAVIVCNGKKDNAFITTALRAQQVGLDVFLVAEAPGEIERVLKIAATLNVEPRLGVRSQITHQVSENGIDSHSHGQEVAPFGLSFPELIDEIDLLKKRNQLGLLQLLHFHNSTETKERQHLRNSIAEITRIYIGLVREGAALTRLDIGGGVPVIRTRDPDSDSDGHPIDWHPEIVVETIKEILEGTGIDHPEILTEAGRTILSQSSVLVFDLVTRSACPPIVNIPTTRDCKALELLTKDLSHAFKSANSLDILSSAKFHRESLYRGFSTGDVDLRQRALGEQIYSEILRVLAASNPELREDLESDIADIDYASFSIFRSAPDIWGLGEVFPFVPIRGLDQPPIRITKIRDLTCDPDGFVNFFQWDGNLKSTLPLPDSDGSTVIGMFLAGAYQEIIGSSHNLFGSCQVVEVTPADNERGFDLEISGGGSTVADMLATVNSCPDSVLQSFASRVESAGNKGIIPEDEVFPIIEDFKAALNANTYYQSGSPSEAIEEIA